MEDTPSEVHIRDWDDEIQIDSTNRVGLSLLAQAAGLRAILLAEVEDFNFSKTTNVFTLEDVDDDADISLDIISVTAQANASSPIDAFFAVYEHISAQPLVDSTEDILPSLNGEFVPLLTLMLDNFTHFDVTVGLAAQVLFVVTFFPAPVFFVFIPPNPEPYASDVNIVGNVILDIWLPFDVSPTIDLLGLATIGFSNPPDYIDNSPIHILPFGEPILVELFSAVFGFDGFHSFEEQHNLTLFTDY